MATPTVFDYSKPNWTSLYNFLLDVDFSVCLEEDDVDVIWLLFRNIVSSAMQRFIPVVKMRRNQFPCRYTAGLRHHSKCLKTLRRKYRKNPSQVNLEKLTTAEQIFQEDLVLAKEANENNLFHQLGSSSSS